MKSILTICVAASICSAALAQNTSDTTISLADIHHYCKSEMTDELWFDYDKCDLETVTIYQGNTAYIFKLTSIAEINIETIVKRKKTISKLLLVTYPAAKIKSESKSSSSSLVIEGIGLIDSNNGLGFIDNLNIYGDAKKLKELKLLLDSIITQSGV